MSIVTTRPEGRAKPLDYHTALDLIGGLSDTSKMPGFSWSTPASACVTGSALHAAGKHTVCGSCYALKGFYLYPQVQAALEKRLHLINHEPRFVEAFIFVLKFKLKSSRTQDAHHFRWFDSGDLPSVEALIKICQIAAGTPEIKHWLPTREMGFIRQFLDEGNVIPPNLQIRTSVALIGAKPNRKPFGLAIATVGRDDDTSIFQCPAAGQGGKCGDCRNCWGPGDVNYRQH